MFSPHPLLSCPWHITPAFACLSICFPFLSFHSSYTPLDPLPHPLSLFLVHLLSWATPPRNSLNTNLNYFLPNRNKLHSQWVLFPLSSLIDTFLGYSSLFIVFTVLCILHIWSSFFVHLITPSLYRNGGVITNRWTKNRNSKTWTGSSSSSSLLLLSKLL